MSGEISVITVTVLLSGVPHILGLIIVHCTMRLRLRLGSGRVVKSRLVLVTSEASPVSWLSIAVSAKEGQSDRLAVVNLLSGEILVVVREDGTEGEHDQTDL